ncbi:MAG: PH domain-containing protein [Leifsonia sp.]
MTNPGDATTGEAHPSLPSERIVARLRRHGRALFWPSLALVVATGAAFYFAWTLPEEWMRWAVWGGLAAVVLFAWLVPLLWWAGQRCTITTRRVIVRSGFFIRVRQEVLYTRIYDVSVRTSWLQSAFRSGDVLINTGADRPVVLRDVPSAALVQRSLHDLTDAAHGAGTRMRWQDDPSALPDQTVVWGGR